MLYHRTLFVAHLCPHRLKRNVYKTFYNCKGERKFYLPTLKYMSIINVQLVFWYLTKNVQISKSSRPKC